MPSFSLTTQTMRISPVGTDYPLVDSFMKGEDLLQVLNAYLQELKHTCHLNRKKRFLLRVTRFEKIRRTVSGLMEAGEYGIESSLLDKDKRTTSYKRLPTDAELTPYYFLIAVPQESNQALAIFQKTGSTSIKEKFELDFGDYFFDHYGRNIEVNRLMPTHLINQLLDQGRVMKIKFVKFGIPSDLADAVSKGHNVKEGVTEYRIMAKRGKAFNLPRSIRTTINRQRDEKSFFEIRGIKYDDVNVQVNVDGRYRTFSILNPDNLRTEYDVTSELNIRNGNPTYASMNKAARKLLAEIAKSLGILV